MRRPNKFGRILSPNKFANSVVPGRALKDGAVTTAKLASPTGADTNVATGTKGTDGNLSQWNGDGDLVDASVVAANVATSDGTTGGSGSAGAGNQYVELTIGGITYKVLHDGTV